MTDSTYEWLTIWCNMNPAMKSSPQGVFLRFMLLLALCPGTLPRVWIPVKNIWMVSWNPMSPTFYLKFDNIACKWRHIFLKHVTPTLSTTPRVRELPVLSYMVARPWGSPRLLLLYVLLRWLQYHISLRAVVAAAAILLVTFLLVGGVGGSVFWVCFEIVRVFEDLSRIIYIVYFGHQSRMFLSLIHQLNSFCAAHLYRSSRCSYVYVRRWMRPLPTNTTGERHRWASVRERTAKPSRPRWHCDPSSRVSRHS